MKTRLLGAWVDLVWIAYRLTGERPDSYWGRKYVQAWDRWYESAKVAKR